MEQERLDPELDDLLSDIHRLIDEDGAPENLTETPEYNDDFDFTGLFDDMELPETEAVAEPVLETPAPQPEPVPEPGRWTDKQKLPKHVAKLQKNQDQAYADWLYAQEQAGEPAPIPVQQIDSQLQELRPTRWTDRQRVPRHVAKLQQHQDQAYADWLYEQDRRSAQPAAIPEEPENAAPKKKRKQKQPQPEPAFDPDTYAPPKKKRHGFRNFLIFLLVLTLAAAAAVVFLLPEKPVSVGAGRKSGVSTILLAGTDAGGMRTDTLMLLTLDREAGSMSLVSIPRDTLVNGSYTVPKINTVYGANNGGYEGMEMLMTRVGQCIGFEPDGYILLQLDAFTKVVDLLGGVEFDVPVDMFYNDPGQGLHIALEAGKQLLSGEEALGLVRFRSGYADADLSRVQVQRDFLAALIRQAISPEGVLNAPLLLNVLQNHTQTDLNARNFLWLAETVLLVDRSHVETVTLPGSARNWESGSYYVLDPAAVAQTVNTYCNPYVREVTVEDLEIRTS